MRDLIRRKTALRAPHRSAPPSSAGAIGAVFAVALVLAPVGQTQTWRQSAPAPLLSFHGYETAAQARVVPAPQSPARALAAPPPSAMPPVAQPARPVVRGPADLAAQALSHYAAGFAADPDPLVTLTAKLFPRGGPDVAVVGR